MEYTLEIHPHPAQAQFGGKALFKDGKPVPLLPDHASIRMVSEQWPNGCCIAYIVPSGRVAFLRNDLPTFVKNEAIEKAKEFEPTLGDERGTFTEPPERTEVEVDDELED